MNQNIISVKCQRTKQTDEAFKEFMRLTEEEFNQRARRSPGLYKSCSGRQLEKVTVDLLKDVCPQTPFDSREIKLVSGQQFPDIIASNMYGIEVKSTEKNHWTSTGGSIVESTRIEGIERIYMLFGKLGGTPEEFRCRPYEDVLYEVAVTHSPRYLIDMNLGVNESIFSKMNTTYDALRTSSDSINQVRQYYVKKAKEEHKTSMPWWLGNDTQMVIQLWSSVNKEEKEILQSKMCILFPEILKNKRDKYARIALWLCAKYSILLYNTRDCFSAGGQCSKLNGKYMGFKVSQVVARYLNHAKTIKEMFRDISIIKDEIIEFNSEIWSDKENQVYKNWLNQINVLMQSQIINDMEYGQITNIPFSDWFEKEYVLE